jgi:hypothetical protein
VILGLNEVKLSYFCLTFIIFYYSTRFENAVVIEQLANRYYGDFDTVSFYNMIGAYQYGDFIVLVRIGLKENGNGKHLIYTIICE